MKVNRPFTRRSFLKSALATGLTPLLLPARLWAAQPAANDQITLGFIGMGTQNRGLLNNFLRHSNTRTLAVCDVDTNRRVDAKKIVDTFMGT